MKKFETKYISDRFDDATDLIVTISNGAINSDRILIEYFNKRWRTQAEAIKFYEWVIKQIKGIPEENKK